MQPAVVNKTLMKAARAELERKKKAQPMLKDVRLEDLAEGSCAQIMHLGPWDNETPTITKLHAFITEQGKGLRGTHHEIYLNDVRRVAPEKLRTILRQPIR
ncbi:MAG: GyrI-like domain-containing protein [Flavobacteriales bacterium]|nr:GyrI-like domain-containing protein [Flavobacteriales bacterium]